MTPAELPLEIAEPPVATAPGGRGGIPARLLALARRPWCGAAAAALTVSGAVSSASQLLISGGLHRLGVSTDRIGLAFSVAAVCYIAVSAVIVRLGGRARTLRFNALATAALAVALVPALAGTGTVALVMALMLTAAPRAAISTIAYSLASQRSDADSAHPGGDGVVFGMLNGAWAAATVLMPLLAGALEQAAGVEVAYLAVIIPSWPSPPAWSRAPPAACRPYVSACAVGAASADPSIACSRRSSASGMWQRMPCPASSSRSSGSVVSQISPILRGQRV